MYLKITVIAAFCLGGLTAFKLPPQKRHVVPPSPPFADFKQPIPSIQAAGNYFQDLYVAQQNPKELEFGHVAESPNNWEQRFEKIDLKTLNRQGKVRWGDKNGGYGEQYWDLNHAGAGEGEEEEEETEKQQPSEVKIKKTNAIRPKRNPDDDVEFINEQARSSIFNGKAPRHGGNYRKAKEAHRPKRQS